SNDPAATPSVSFDYDRLGRRKTAATTSGGTTLDSIAYSFDDASQPLGESHSGTLLNGLGVSVTINNALQRQNLSLTGVAGYSVGYGYDSAGRLQTVTSGNATVTYSYVANSMLVGQISSVQAGTSMTTTKNYDLLNRLTSISSVVSGAAAPTLPISFGYQYNQAGQRTRTTLADGSYWIYTYDSLGQVVSGKRYWSDGTPVAGQQFEYGFDTIGNRKTTGVGGDASGGGIRGNSYGANRLNQYSSRTVSGAVDLLGIANPTASVTVNGNATYRKGEYFDYVLPVSNGSAPQYPSVTVSSTYPPGQSSSGSVFVPKTPENFSYDSDGNLTNDGRWSYVWDGENRLVKMESLANAPAGSKCRSEFTYDQQSRRIKSKVTNLDTGAVASENKFLYDAWNLLAELNATNSTIIRSFVWRSDLSGSLHGAGGVGGLLQITYNGLTTTNCFVAYDGNGNIASLTDANGGAPVARYEYGPFGEVIRATGPMAKASPLRFSTEYQDEETDLICFARRYYSLSTGRWLNTDPINERGGRNLYCCVCNSPLSSIDLLGLLTMTSRPLGLFPCGGFGISWVYSLATPAGNVGPGRISGYIVNHVEFVYSARTCNGTPLSLHAEFYEAMPVLSGAPTPFVADTWRYPESYGTVGRWTFTGEAKYFPVSVTGDLGNVRIPSPAPIEPVWSPGTSYGDVPLQPPPWGVGSGVFPSTGQPPAFWNNTPVEATPPVTFLRTWDCCCPNNPSSIGELQVSSPANTIQ
ncbi:MAG TPA: RHS repeat-associated core domain-containing protein, partial [Verrucomicrobiae bacterium]